MTTLRIKRLAAVAGIAASTLAFAAAGAPAQADDGNGLAKPQIVGGQKAADTPYIVQLTFHQGGQDGTFGCTGEAINSEWVLTAQHCTDGDSDMQVTFSNKTGNGGDTNPGDGGDNGNNPGDGTNPGDDNGWGNWGDWDNWDNWDDWGNFGDNGEQAQGKDAGNGDQGQTVKADRLENSPNGDVGLVHLAHPVKLDHYAKLASSYTPKEGDQGDIFGYGLRANRQEADALYTAHVNVLGESTDAYNGKAIHVQGINGASNHGDSGGPLIVNGKVVGVCSTGDTQDPGADIQASSNYANLTGSRSWISQTAGI